jgi:hypothetical protein
MRSRTRIGSAIAVAALAAVVIAFDTPPAGAFAPGALPCALISSTALTSDLGQAKVEEDPTIGPMYPTETDGRVRSECKGFAWRGGKPTSATEALKRLSSGSVAEFFIQTWVPDTTAPEENQLEWSGPEKGFDDTVHTYEQGGVKSAISGLSALMHGSAFMPPLFGAEADIGAKGVVALGHGQGAGGAWWSQSTHEIVIVAIVGSKRRHIQKQLEKIAKVVVPTFF